jgi:4'-phosphopantetheinyl transferase
MVYIYYTRTDRKLETDTYSRLLEQLPAVCQNRINRFFRWQDAQQSLLGLHLLKKGLRFMGKEPSLMENFKYGTGAKPCLAPHVDFNISHAGNFSICALSTDVTVGIDIEEVISRPLHEFEGQFTKQEWEQITNSKEGLKSFFTCWTKKESLVKATGKGLTTDLSLISTLSDQVDWDGTNWRWVELSIHQDYVAHLACNVRSPQVHLKECVVESAYFVEG